MISFSYPFENFIAVVYDPRIFFWIAESVADAAVINPKGIKTLLARDVNTFLVNSKPTFVRVPKKVSNPPFWLIIF